MTKTAKPAKSVITEPMKLFIVRQLATHDPPSVVAAAVLEEFSVKLTSQQVERYNPERAAGKDLGAKLKAEFERARKAFEDDLEGIPEAKKAVRLRMLAKAARAAQIRGNHVAMAGFLEQIAKETGEAFTNRREITGKGGGPVAFTDLTDAQLDSKLLALMAGGGTGGDGGV